MEMMVNIMGLGFAVPKTGFGLNAYTGSYIGFRNSVGPEKLIGLHDVLSIGAKSGTMIFSWIKTKYFYVDLVRHGWIADIGRLIGKKAEIEVSGSLITHGTVDMKFTVFDKHGNSNELLSKVDIEAVGLQASNTKVRGILVF